MEVEIQGLEYVLRTHWQRLIPLSRHLLPSGTSLPGWLLVPAAKAELSRPGERTTGMGFDTPP